MLIKKFSIPSEEVIKEIREVESVCKEHDKLNGNLFLDTSLNFNPDIKSLFLLYEDSKLVSLISMFIPRKEEAELSAYTLPSYRRRGYFKKLLDEAVKEIRKYQIEDLLFVCEPQSEDGKSSVKELGGELDYTEYFLRYKGLSNDSEDQKVYRIKLLEAGQRDLESIVSLSQEIFNDDYEDAKSIVTKSFEVENRIQYIAILDRKPIGMVSVSFENDESYLCGVGVSPQYQRKGFGREIMKLILKELKNAGKENITIEVDSSNENAFNLYRKCGFNVETSFDYYRKRVI